MYAIETKKRKFDRILETIKDHTTSQRQSVEAPRRENASSTSLTGESASAKKQRLDPTPMSTTTASPASLPRSASYLPASREAFLERLESFARITKWHIPSTEDISAVAWAKRGWWCIDTDLVGCRACSEERLVQLDEQEDAMASKAAAQEQEEDDEDEFSTAAALRHRLLVEKYCGMIITAHAESCPWRNRGCDESIQRISGLLNTRGTIQALKARYDGLRNLEIPPVHKPSAEFSHLAQDVADFRFDLNEQEPPKPDTLRLAICGWHASPTRDDVAECHACFRSLGLWMHRGEEPLMEKLDAVESHLEYCPWRSSTAQRTEIEIQGQTRMVPAWVLVTRAAKEAVHHHPAVEPSAEEYQPQPRELGEKERETKVKELLRRVKDLKKPFNVKALLRKKLTVA